MYYYKEAKKIILPMHTRKLNRLKGYDYSRDGYYFVTICVKDKIKYFGEVKNGKTILNKYGKIARQQWLWLEQQYPYIELDQFIIMPNHMHGLVLINSEKIKNAAGRSRSRRDRFGRDRFGRDRSRPVPTTANINNNNFKILSLSNIIGAFKTASSKMIHESGLAEFKWQRSFYDHIVRQQKSLQIIRRYIYYNPAECLSAFGGEIRPQ